ILSEHFIQKYAEANGVVRPSLTPEAKEILRQHQWRGNVRELENTMHRAVLLAQDGRIVPDSILLSGVRRPAERPTASAQPAQPARRAGNQGDDGFLAFGDEPAETRRLVGRTVAEVERDLIIDTLSHCLGNRTHAAN